VNYCTKCGAPLKEEDKFCPVCGAHEGNVTRIVVKDNTDKVLLEIPATVGVVGAILAPWFLALGVIAALVTNCKIVVERRE